MLPEEQSSQQSSQHHKTFTASSYANRKPDNKVGSGQWFSSPSAKEANPVRVLWDSQLEIPLQVQSRQGQALRSTTVKLLAPSAGLPWQAAARFARKDYSDFLD